MGDVTNGIPAGFRLGFWAKDEAHAGHAVHDTLGEGQKQQALRGGVVAIPVVRLRKRHGERGVPT